MEYIFDKYSVVPILTDDRWKECCYLITCKNSGEQALVDPGNDADGICMIIESNGNKKLKYILLTHGHHDHVGEVENVAVKYGVKALIHENDLKLVRHAPVYSVRFDSRLIKTPRAVEAFTKEVYEFSEGESFKILHTPGHTEGSVCFVFDGFVFTGDTILKGLIGRTDLPDSRPEKIGPSVETLFSSVKDTDVIFPGHGNAWKAEEAKVWWNQLMTKPPQHTTFDEIK